MKTYEEVLAIQNSGIACPCCASTSGHFARCPLLNRNTAENRSAEKEDISHTDAEFLRDFHIRWN